MGTREQSVEESQGIDRIGLVAGLRLCSTIHCPGRRQALPQASRAVAQGRPLTSLVRNIRCRAPLHDRASILGHMTRARIGSCRAADRKRLRQQLFPDDFHLAVAIPPSPHHHQHRPLSNPPITLSSTPPKCLAAAAPLSMSLASARAPARATSPTNSNGTSPPSCLRPAASRSSHATQPSPAANADGERDTGLLQWHGAPFVHACAVRILFTCIPMRPLYSLRKTYTNNSVKVRTPRPMRHPCPSYRIQQTVSIYILYMLASASDTNWKSSFAFVEYESRRDADDAYHEMHNKRIGRDDLLKIEVWHRMSWEHLT